jgi:chaperonin GroEL (HSP60 family)
LYSLFDRRIGQIKAVKKAKVAVYTCGLDIAQTETKGTVLIKSADEMLNFTRGEEKHMEKVRVSSKPESDSSQFYYRLYPRSSRK